MLRVQGRRRNVLLNGESAAAIHAPV
jgi:hypothetical protein